jgi:hypothetical protein
MPTPAPPDLRLPSFLILGVQRSGTRWLRVNLDQHPDIFMPSFELSYFTNTRRQNRPGRKWYSHQFEAWNGEAFVGESSPAYLQPSNSPRDVAERINALVPEARLIAIVRSPVERMYSAMVHQIKRGRLPADADLFELIQSNDPVVAELDLVEASLYFKHLKWWIDELGERLLILVHDDIRDRPAVAYETALRHIGASTDFVPPTLDRVVFSNRNSVRAVRLTDEQRRILYTELFRADVEEFEALLGRPLWGWDPGPPPLVPLSEIAPSAAVADDGESEPEPAAEAEKVEEPDAV